MCVCVFATGVNVERILYQFYLRVFEKLLYRNMNVCVFATGVNVERILYQFDLRVFEKLLYGV